MTTSDDRIQQSVDSMTTTWLEQAKAGNEPAWQRLDRVYRKLVLWWCVKSGLPRKDAEDVVQEVFIAVQRGLGTYEHGSFRGWLWRITKARVIDYWRNHYKQPILGGRQAIDDILDRVEDESNRQLGTVDQSTKILFDEVVSMVKGEFNETHWQAFWMRVVLGKSAQEVADELGVTRTVVHNATSRIRRRINEEFGAVNGE